MTPNYYTGCTLENKQAVTTAGIDNLAWYVDDQLRFDKEMPFTINMGYFRGFPWRFEGGLRYFFPYEIETIVRHQLNPRSFKYFNASINLHSIRFVGLQSKMILSQPYYKYGLTISKELGSIHPYISLYHYDTSDLTDKNLTSTLSFGIQIPHKESWIYPEINYYGVNSKYGFMTFGIGVRSLIKKKAKHKRQD